MRTKLSIALLMLAVGVVLAGCQASQGGGGGKVATQLAANLDDFDIHRVAILGFANNAGDPEANEMGDTMIRAIYATETYQFINSSTFAMDAKRVGVEDAYDRMMSTWMKKHTVDRLVAEKVLGATGYDAVIGIEITKWEEVKLEPTQEGTSDTSVGVRVNMFAADGTLLWSASDLRTEHSTTYLPRYNISATQSGESRTTNLSAVPDPPEIRKVAMKVAQAVAATLPVIKAGTDKPAGTSE